VAAGEWNQWDAGRLCQRAWRRRRQVGKLERRRRSRRWLAEHDVDKIADCPVMLTIGVIGGKWKPRILWLLRSGPMRFSDFTRAIPDASEKMLAQHLKALGPSGSSFAGSFSMAPSSAQSTVTAITGAP
jgi:hypothetical protein